MRLLCRVHPRPLLDILIYLATTLFSVAWFGLLLSSAGRWTAGILASFYAFCVELLPVSTLTPCFTSQMLLTSLELYANPCRYAQIYKLTLPADYSLGWLT